MPISLGPFREVADRVHLAVAEPASVTVGLVVGTTGALLVDTGSSPEQGRAIRRAAQDVAGSVPLTDVVVTHAHWDHLYGLAAFADLTTYGHRDLAAAVAADPGLDDDLATAGLSREELVLPRRTFALAAMIQLGDAHVEVMHFGRGHTSHDATVIVPTRGVVFAGDLLESAAPPSAGPDSHPADWARTLDPTLGVLRADTVVVPGHGPTIDRTEAFAQREEIAWVSAQLEDLFRRRVAPAEVWGRRDRWPWPRETVESWARVVYDRLRESGAKPARTLPLLRG